MKGSLGEKKDMARALQAFLEINRDAEKIVIWLDNCSSQNKNWALFSHLVKLQCDTGRVNRAQLPRARSYLHVS